MLVHEHFFFQKDIWSLHYNFIFIFMIYVKCSPKNNVYWVFFMADLFPQISKEAIQTLVLFRDFGAEKLKINLPFDCLCDWRRRFQETNFSVFHVIVFHQSCRNTQKKLWHHSHRNTTMNGYGMKRVICNVFIYKISITNC